MRVRVCVFVCERLGSRIYLESLWNTVSRSVICFLVDSIRFLLKSSLSFVFFHVHSMIEEEANDAMYRKIRDFHVAVAIAVVVAVAVDISYSLISITDQS